MKFLLAAAFLLSPLQDDAQQVQTKLREVQASMEKLREAGEEDSDEFMRLARTEKSLLRRLEKEKRKGGDRKEKGKRMDRRTDSDKASLQEVEERLRENPDDVKALVERAGYRLEKGQVEAALRDLNLAIELAPESLTAYLKRAVAHALLGQLEQADRDVRWVIRLAPKAREELGHLMRAVEKRARESRYRNRSREDIQEQIRTLGERIEELLAIADDAELTKEKRQWAKEKKDRVNDEIKNLNELLRDRPSRANQDPGSLERGIRELESRIKETGEALRSAEREKEGLRDKLREQLLRLADLRQEHLDGRENSYKAGIEAMFLNQLRQLLEKKR